MSRKQYGFMILLAIVAGLVGGMLSSQFLMGEPVFAQKTPQAQKVIEAQEFRVVDKDGKSRVRLAGGSIVIYDLVPYPRFANGLNNEFQRFKGQSRLIRTYFARR